jgi:phosphatidylserine decarboxylase
MSRTTDTDVFRPLDTEFGRSANDNVPAESEAGLKPVMTSKVGGATARQTKAHVAAAQVSQTPELGTAEERVSVGSVRMEYFRSEVGSNDVRAQPERGGRNSGTAGMLDGYEDLASLRLSWSALPFQATCPPLADSSAQCRNPPVSEMSMGQMQPLPVWDRRAGKLFEEGADDPSATYDTRPSRSLSEWARSLPLYDRLVAAYQNTHWSTREIEPFIRQHRIDMSEFEPVTYRSFAEFFDRTFRPGVRDFPAAAPVMGAFAEARYLAWEKLEPEQTFPIKGRSLSPAHILGKAKRAQPYIGGPVLLARLSPVDYHHVHYPDDGRLLAHARRGGRLWTVNWHALRNKEDILFQNERQIHILQTRNFGRLAFVEVGALSVGRIVQVHPLPKPFCRGEEKSVFKFGGSAIVVFGEPGRWRPCDDLLQRTSEGIETLVRLGEPVAEVAKDAIATAGQ